MSSRLGFYNDGAIDTHYPASSYEVGQVGGIYLLPLDPLFPFIAAKCLARKPSTRARSSWQAGKKNFFSLLPLDFAFCMLCHWLKVRVFRGGMRVIGIGDGSKFWPKMIRFSWYLKFQQNFVKKQQIHPPKKFIGKIGLKFGAHLAIY